MTKSNIRESNDTDVRNSNELVLKRFKMNRDASGVVFAFRRILSGRWAREQKKDPNWADALEELIKTHPALKNLKPENED